MAPHDPPDLDEPARKLARKLLAREGLRPPVDIERLLRQYADVERVALPVSGDAVVVRRPDKRPKVYLNRDSPNENRLRFTMGHELGHLIMPWQPGTLVCHTRVTYKFDDFLVAEFEKQANVFSSEALVPSDWAREQLLVLDDLADRIVSIARLAGVSHVVAILGLARHCPPGTLLLIIDVRTGEVEYTAKSRRSTFTVPPVWSAIHDEDVRRNGGVISIANSTGGRIIKAIQFPEGPIYVRPRRASKEILAKILDELGYVDQERQRLVMSISGIVGAANNVSREGSREELRSYLASVFTGRQGGTLAVSRHRAFKEFLDAKAAELHDRRRVR